VRLHKSEGSEHDGTRPCVVVQNDIGNTYSPVTIVVAFAKREGAKLFDASVEVDAPEGGLDRDSVAECQHIYTVSKSRLYKVLGSLEPSTMERIDNALRASLGLVRSGSPLVG
jgi:mRNA interferase MazF